MSISCRRAAIRLVAASATLVALAVAALAAAPASAESEAATERIAGADRFATAAELARRVDANPQRVWLATGTDFADALAASAAGEPVLLATASRLPDVTADALADLRPDDVVAVGGEQAISAAVLSQAADAADGEADRAGGAHRFATAAQVAARTHPDGAEVVWLATGGSFADALAAAPAAVADEAPLLLTGHAELPDATADELARLDPDQVVVVGGTAAVTDAVKDAAAAAGSADADRVAGANRFSTAVQIAERTDTEHGTGSVSYLATGADFPDALAAGPAAAKDDAPLLLATREILPEETREALLARGDDTVRLVGGTSALSDAVRDHAARPDEPPAPPGVCDRYDATAGGAIQGHPEGPRLHLDAWSGPWMVDHFRNGWELAVPYRWRFDVVNEEGHGGVLFYEDSQASGGDPYAHRNALTVFCGNPFLVAGGRQLGDDAEEIAEHGPHGPLGEPDVERFDRPGVVYSAEWHELGNADPRDDRVQRYDYVVVGGDVLMLYFEMENHFARDHAGQTGAIADAVAASVDSAGSVGCPSNASQCRDDRDRTQGGTPP